jgi:hypothetical protein
MNDPDTRTDDETARFRDEIVKRMIATPPQLRKKPKGREPKPAPKSP